MDTETRSDYKDTDSVFVEPDYFDVKFTSKNGFDTEHLVKTILGLWTMDLADIILTVIGLGTTVIIAVLKSIVTDVKDLENSMNHCQSNMPKDYLLKQEYREDQRSLKSDIKEDISEIKHLIGKLFDKVEGKKWSTCHYA